MGGFVTSAFARCLDDVVVPSVCQVGLVGLHPPVPVAGGLLLHRHQLACGSVLLMPATDADGGGGVGLEGLLFGSSTRVGGSS